MAGEESGTQGKGKGKRGLWNGEERQQKCSGHANAWAIFLKDSKITLNDRGRSRREGWNSALTRGCRRGLNRDRASIAFVYFLSRSTCAPPRSCVCGGFFVCYFFIPSSRECARVHKNRRAHERREKISHQTIFHDENHRNDLTPLNSPQQTNLPLPFSSRERFWLWPR